MSSRPEQRDPSTRPRMTNFYMKKLIIIGTLHGGLTPSEELIAEIERHRPDRVLVEIAKDDIKNVTLAKYPPEMIAAYEWARAKGIDVHGYDTGLSTFRDGAGEAENNALIKKQDERLGSLTWKDLNRKEHDTLLNVDELDKVVDHNKEAEREQAMLVNINRLILAEGTTVIITGTGHLPLFEKNLKEALFPLRK